jgi:hypothetical protein
VVSAVADAPIRLYIAVCNGDASTATINEDERRGHGPFLKTRLGDRPAPPHTPCDLATHDSFEDLRLVEECTEHPETDCTAHCCSAEDSTMTLATELEGLIGCYLLGTRNLEDLRSWLYDHVQAVLDSSDPRLDELEGELWLLISEYDRRDRDEASIHAALRLLLDKSVSTQSSASPRV